MDVGARGAPERLARVRRRADGCRTGRGGRCCRSARRDPRAPARRLARRQRGGRPGGGAHLRPALRPRGSRSDGSSRSTPSTAATTARWRPTTPLPSTAVTPSRAARSAGRRTPTARRSTSTRSRTRTSSAGACFPRRGAPYLDRTRVRPGWRCRAAPRRGLRRRGLAVGRPLDRVAGLPALLGHRGLTADWPSRASAATLGGSAMVHRTRAAAVLLVPVGVLGLAACGGSSPPATQSTPAGEGARRATGAPGSCTGTRAPSTRSTASP